MSVNTLLPLSMVLSAQHTVPSTNATPSSLGPAQAPLTQVVGDVAQVRLHHGRVQRQVMAQQLEVPGVVLKVCLTRER